MNLLLHLAVVEITNNCNLRCKHCYGFFSGNKIINISNFQNICQQLSLLGVNTITLTGGEPLIMGRGIKKYIKISKEHFKTVNLTTNGTLINCKSVKYLKDIDCVQISIDGTEKIHNYIRGLGTFRKAINAIKLLKSNNISCSIMMAVSDYNLHSLKEIYTLSKSLNVPLGFERVTSIGRGKKFFSLSKINTKRLIKYSQAFKIESTDPLCIINNKSKRNYLLKNKIIAGCLAANMAITIDSNMNLLPCSRLRLPLGNLKKVKIIDILKKSKIAKELSNRNLLKGKCGGCTYKFICGGCRANAFALTGDYLEEDSHCFI